MDQMKTLSDGLIAVVKEDCPTCRLIVPVLAQLTAASQPLTILTQDTASFLVPIPANKKSTVIELDATLEQSYRLQIETVPTLIKVVGGVETGRIVGWQRTEWERFTDMARLGIGLPDWRPGCGAKNVDPAIKDQLDLRFGAVKMNARLLAISEEEDLIEACYARGWSDGMPLVPPTKLRVYRMLQGTVRDAADIIGYMPHNNASVTVEKVAINAVMAGCKPEYMPVVLAAVTAACDPAYGLRAFMASTWFSAPVVIVSGPMTKKLGMASGFSAFGSGNRANATIGRALNLLIRNLGEVRPGEVARSTMGNTGRYSFCFAENEENTSWLSLASEQGIPKGRSAVTLITGDGVQPVADERSRTADSLTISLAASLRNVYHHKWASISDVILAVSPEHSRVFEAAGWSKARVRQELAARLQLDSRTLVAGADGCAEGMSAQFAAEHPLVPKFKAADIHIVRVGSDAGLYSAVISCWPTNGAEGVQLVTKVIEEV